MIRTSIRCLAAAAALFWTAADVHADLFAVMNPPTEILRINSETGAVKRTYLLPPEVANERPLTGLALDGRVLYVNTSFNTTWRLDVVNDFWYPPGQLEPFPQHFDQLFSGLGFWRDPLYGSTLIAVSRTRMNNAPSYISKHILIDDFYFHPWWQEFYEEFPPNMVAHGVDVEPATGEIWAIADEIIGTSRVPRLLKFDHAGHVQSIVAPPANGTIYRGVGFHGGSMFIGGRNLPAQMNVIYEIDRSTGAVLRSFPLTSTGQLGALTGGTVVPEPNAILLVSLGSFLGAAARRKRHR